METEYKLKPDLGDILRFIRNFLKRLEPLGIDEEKLFDIRLTLEEALINAVKHGSREDKTKFIFLKIKASAKILEIEIEDEGQGFDYENLPSPAQDANLEKLSGRGVFLIRNLMDKVEFFNRGRKMRMVKYLK